MEDIKQVQLLEEVDQDTSVVEDPDMFKVLVADHPTSQDTQDVCLLQKTLQKITLPL